MTAVVIDASVALAWCFEDEKSAYAEAVLDALRRHPAVVPSLWALEVGNVLTIAKRRKRITAKQFEDAVAVLRELPVRVDETGSDAIWERVQPLAEQHDLTVYDAAYLDVAVRLGLPLASLDLRMRRAASNARVGLFEPEA